MIARGGALLALVLAAPGGADDIDTGADGFSFEIAFEAEAEPGAAFAALADVGAWWSPDHTYSGDAANMSVELTAGGCFCEVWDAGAVKHAEVVQVIGDRMVRMTGGLGPLQDLGVSQVHDWLIEPTDGGVRVAYRTRVGGRQSDQLAEIAPIVHHVMSEQLGRLERYVRAGSPE